MILSPTSKSSRVDTLRCFVLRAGSYSISSISGYCLRLHILALLSVVILVSVIVIVTITVIVIVIV